MLIKDHINVLVTSLLFSDRAWWLVYNFGRDSEQRTVKGNGSVFG